MAEERLRPDALGAYAEKYARRPPPAQRWHRIAVRRVYASEEATYPESATFMF